MQLPAPMNEGAPGPGPGLGPASPSSPVSDPGSSKSTPTAREKPVKVLPCPRCESLNTKFCYYNNYSVTQPRHFCRQCQRYWTAGGTLRNVPVGGGSRKKNRHPHSRPGEPYSQRSPGAGAGASGSNHQFALPNGVFQQQHDMVAALNLPGFALQGHQYGAPFGLEQLSQLSPGVYASILNKAPQQQEPESNPSLHAMFANPESINQGSYFTAATTLPFHTDHTVKPEFWPVSTNMAAPQGNYPPSSNRFESSSSMLLNLGLNNGRPPWDQSRDQSRDQLRDQSQGQLRDQSRDQSQGQLRDQSRDHQSVDVKPAASTTGKNGSSPLHGSSIEEEGSTPSNGFSKGGYEEGDGVSSMWHSLHDMDNLHLSVKW